jgi:sigma-B regulation protein RsbU (phosphoserine phosphatase)
VIADVAGKGVPAALIMASFRASLIAEIRNNYAIRAIMKKVNKLMTESLDKGNFVTAVYGVLDSRNRILTYSNAGHNPPLLFRQSGEVQELTYGGLAFGIKDDVRYSEQPLHLDPGDSLVLFTDGVTEAQNDKGEDFDNSRLIETFRKNEHKSAHEIVEAITSEVLKFKAEDFILDDLTLMVLKST